MEKENKVSVWIGSSNAEKDFENYILESYNDEGDMESLFMKDFQIDYYDPQFRECLFKTNNIEQALKDFSYSKSFLSKITKYLLPESNAFILLYNFDYEASVTERSGFKFIGAFDYQ